MNTIYTSYCLEVCNFRSISLYRFDYLLYPNLILKYLPRRPTVRVGNISRDILFSRRVGHMSLQI